MKAPKLVNVNLVEKTQSAQNTLSTTTERKTTFMLKKIDRQDTGQNTCVLHCTK